MHPQAQPGQLPPQCVVSASFVPPVHCCVLRCALPLPPLREAAAVQAESVEAVLATGARRSRDAEKAAGVRAQQRLWGAALELRIRLQKALSGANVLPRPDAHRLLVANNQQVARG